MKALKELLDLAGYIRMLNRELQMRNRLLKHQWKMLDYYNRREGREYRTAEARRFRQMLHDRLLHIGEELMDAPTEEAGGKEDRSNCMQRQG